MLAAVAKGEAASSNPSMTSWGRSMAVLCGSAELLLMLGDGVTVLCSSWGSNGSVVHAVTGICSTVTARRARPTVCSAGLKDRGCMCQVVVGSGGMLVGWPAAPAKESPAPGPAWGLPCIAAPPGRAAGLGGPSCSPLLPAGTLSVARGTRMPVERDKAAAAGSTPRGPSRQELPPALPELGLPAGAGVGPAAGGSSWHMAGSEGSSALLLSTTREMLPDSDESSVETRGCPFISPACAEGE